MTARATPCLVIGAGIAGATVAALLARESVAVTVLEAADDIAAGASATPRAIIYPKLVDAARTPSHLQSAAWLRALHHLGDDALADCFTRTGVLWLDRRRNAPRIDADHPWWGREVRAVDAAAASALAGVPIPRDGLWLPDAGVVDSRALIRRLLDRPGIRTCCATPATALRREGDGWRVSTPAGDWLAGHVVLALAGDAPALVPDAVLPLRPVRGQISRLPASLPLRTTLCYGGYLTPALDGTHCLGATFQPGRRDREVAPADHRTNLDELGRCLPALAGRLGGIDNWQTSAGVRWQTPDYLPLAGALPDITAWVRVLERTPGGRRPVLPPAAENRLHVTLGHGAKGFSQAWLAAEHVVAGLLGRISPWQGVHADAMRPERFLLRDWKRGRLPALSS